MAVHAPVFPLAWLTRRLWPHVLAVGLIGTVTALTFAREAPDTSRYMAEARNLLAYGMFSLDGQTPTVRDVPGFPLLLAFLERLPLLGAQVWMRFLNGVCLALIAAGCARAVHLCRGGIQAYGWLEVLAVYAGGLYPPLLGSCLFVLTELPFTALWLWSNLLILAALVVPAANRLRAWMLAGALLAAACYFRPIPLLFPLLALPVAVLLARRQAAGGESPQKGWSRHLLRAGACLGVFVAAILPWSLRNARVTDTFCPFASGTGMHLYIGASQEWKAEYPDFEPVVDLMGPGVSLTAADAELGRRAREQIRADPGAWLRLAPLKGYRLWLGVPGSKRQISSGLLTAILFALGLLNLILAMVGVWRTRGSAWGCWLLLPPLYVWGLHTVLFAMPRFRIPVEPYLLAFSVVALGWFMSRLTVRRVNPCRPEP